jgi:hypothetical protein
MEHSYTTEDRWLAAESECGRLRRLCTDLQRRLAEAEAKLATEREKQRKAEWREGILESALREFAQSGAYQEFAREVLNRPYPKALSETEQEGER